jgi:hypothetical protein
MTQTQDEQAIRGLVATFVDGWNAGDGAACARRIQPRKHHN